jgi:hypothetical protein
MSPPSRWIASFALVAASLSTASNGHAQSEPREGRAQPPRERQEDTLRPITVTLNPLGLALNRYGANLEVVPVPHHAFTGSLYMQSTPAWLVRRVSGRSEINDDRAGAGVGGEIGYRLYSGHTGADGLFAGISFVSMPLAYPRIADDLASVDLQRFNASGGAFDIGVQKVTSSGFTIGGGVGVMYLAYSLPDDIRRVPLDLEPHVLPRLLLTAGWSF